MNLKTRSEEKEIMDDLNISGEVIDQTLRELDTINQTLGGNQISLSALKKLISSDQHIIKSIADLGCGGADILIAMNRLALRHQKNIEFFGIDANPHIVAYAQKHTTSYQNIQIEQLEIVPLSIEDAYQSLVRNKEKV